MKPTKTLLALSMTSALFASAVQAAPQVVPGNYAIAAGASLPVTITLDATGGSATYVEDGDSYPAVLTDKFKIEILRVGNGIINDQITGLQSTQVFADTNDTFAHADITVASTSLDTSEFTPGLYQVKISQEGTYTAIDNSTKTAHVTEETSQTRTYFTIRSSSKASDIALIDNTLTRHYLANGEAAGSMTPTTLIEEGDVVQTVQTAAWLEESNYGYDLLSYEDLTANALNGYKVVIIADNNAVWTQTAIDELSRYTTADSVTGTGIMYLGAANLSLTGTINTGTLSVDTTAAATTTNITGLNNSYAGEPTNGDDRGLYTTVQTADNAWLFSGTDLTNSDTFGEHSSNVLAKRIVGLTTDGYQATQEAESTTFSETTFTTTAGHTYNIIGYAPAESGFATPGYFKAGDAAMVFNAATERWSEGLSDRDTNYALVDGYVSTITKTVLDTFLTDCTGAEYSESATAVNTFCGLEAPLTCETNEELNAAGTECVAVVLTCETGEELNAAGTACVTTTPTTPTCGTGEELNTTTNTCDAVEEEEEDTTTTKKSSGGGAFGLGLFGIFGLMGLRRRIR